jgi:hypothetical protein
VGDEAAAERPSKNADEKTMLLQEGCQESCPKKTSVHEHTSMMENLISRNNVKKVSYILSDSR